MSKANETRAIVGKQIAEIRTRRGFAQDMLAARLGMHRNTLSRIETGQSPLEISTLPSIALALDVRITDITDVIEPTNASRGQPKIEKWKNDVRLALHEVHTHRDLEMLSKMVFILAPEAYDRD